KQQIRRDRTHPPAITEGRNEQTPLFLLLEASAPPALASSLRSPMAPSLLAAAASPFLAAGSGSSRPPLGAAPTRRKSLRVAALKYDPAKVAPQSDRVLVRLQQIPEKSAGGVLLPKSAVKFERYLMGEVRYVPRTRRRCYFLMLLLKVPGRRLAASSPPLLRQLRFPGGGPERRHQQAVAVREVG
ncbi:unnamed protein product, partial [Urochloa humidicola]